MNSSLPSESQPHVELRRPIDLWRLSSVLFEAPNPRSPARLLSLFILERILQTGQHCDLDNDTLARCIGRSTHTVRRQLKCLFDQKLFRASVVEGNRYIATVRPLMRLIEEEQALSQREWEDLEIEHLNNEQSFKVLERRARRVVPRHPDAAQQGVRLTRAARALVRVIDEETRSQGCCSLNNRELASKADLSMETVSHWLRRLASYGYITHDETCLAAGEGRILKTHRIGAN